MVKYVAIIYKLLRVKGDKVQWFGALKFRVRVSQLQTRDLKQLHSVTSNLELLVDTFTNVVLGAISHTTAWFYFHACVPLIGRLHNPRVYPEKIWWEEMQCLPRRPKPHHVCPNQTFCKCKL